MFGRSFLDIKDKGKKDLLIFFDLSRSFCKKFLMFLSEVVEGLGDGIKTRHSLCRNDGSTGVDLASSISLQAGTRTNIKKYCI